MMNSKNLPSILSRVAFAAAIPMLLCEAASCGSGDNNTVGVAADATADSTVSGDGSPEGQADAARDSRVDGGLDSEASRDGVGGEGAADGQADIQADAVFDGSAEVGSADADASSAADAADAADARDGSGMDGGGFICPVSVPDGAAAYMAAVASNYCARLASCCGLTGDQFDTTKCVNTFDPRSPGGGAFGTGVPAIYLDSGHIAYDPAAACQCLQEVSAFNCGIVPASAWTAAIQNCPQALIGTSPAGDGGCTSSYECAPGAYCAMDGGVGLCKAIVSEGGACTKSDNCSYITTGSPAEYCGAANTCEATKPLDAGCNASSECASNICLPSICQGGILLANTGLCGYVTDAGPADAADAADGD